MTREQAVAESAISADQQERIWDSFRRWGYLQANLDPLGDLEPVPMPELDVSGPEADAARRVYCGTIGARVHAHPRSRAPPLDRSSAWNRNRRATRSRRSNSRSLIRAEIFEQVLQTRYLGTKRYSLEGEVALLPLARFDPECSRRAWRAASRAGDEPSRPAQRDGAHRRPSQPRKFSRDSKMWTRAAFSAAAT